MQAIVLTGVGSSGGTSAGPAAPGTPSNLSATYTYGLPDSTGNVQVQISIQYSPPSPIGTFTGVDVYLDAPDSSLGLNIADGLEPADGLTPSMQVFAPTFEGFFAYPAVTTIVINVPAPTVQQLWRIYLVAASANTQITPIQYGQTSASLSYQLDVLPPPTVGQGVEYAPNVQNVALTATPTGWTANPNIVLAGSGDQYWEVSVGWTWPTADPAYSKLGGVNIVIINNNNGTGTYIGNVPVSNAGLYVSAHLPILPGSTSYTVVFESYDVNGNKNSYVPGVTPATAPFTVTIPLGPAGEEYCNLVLSDGVDAFVTVNPFNAADGTQLLQVTGYWLQIPQSSSLYDPRFGGAEVVIDKGDGKGPYWSVIKGTIPPIQSNVPQPASVQEWAFYLRSIDINGRGNNIGPLVQFSGGGGSGAVGTAIVTGGVLTSVTMLDNGSGYSGTVTATLVDAEGNAIAGVSLTSNLSGGGVASVTVNTGGSGIVATPVVVVSVGSASGQFNLGKAMSTSFTSQFTIVADAFTISALNANTITTGTLKVGNNGSGVPIEIDVYDSLNNLIGWIGDDHLNSGFVGGWLKQLYAGGSSPSNAPFQVNSSGDLSISGTATYGASFTINTNGVTTTLNNTSAFGSYAGLVCSLNSGGGASYVLPAEIAIVNSGPNTIVRIIAASTAGPGLLEVNTASGSTDIQIQGSFGIDMNYNVTGSVYHINGVQVVGPRQTGVGSPSGFADSVAQTYCQKLYNALSAHGLLV